jgi:hypothetical protein
MLHRIEFPKLRAPDWAVDYGSTLALLYAGHVVRNSFLLCPQHTDYSFLGGWCDRDCLCSENTDLGRELRMHTKFGAACCVLRLDIRQRLWLPYVFIVPQGFVLELAAALAEHRVICVKKVKFRHVIEPLPSHYARAEMNFDPIKALYNIALRQLAYSNYVLRGLADAGVVDYYTLVRRGQPREKGHDAPL